MIELPANAVRGQLNRILQYLEGDEQRKPAPTVRDLLSHIVLQTLAKAPPSQESIRQAVFKRDYISESNLRSSLYNLRKNLDSYYETTGVHDPILISIPKSQLSAHFKPNPGFLPLALIRQAHNLRNRPGRPFWIFERTATKLINEALSLTPATESFAFVYLYAAFVVLEQFESVFEIAEDLVDEDGRPIPLLAIAYRYMEIAHSLDKGLDERVTMWIMLARLAMSSGQWLNAAIAFSRALQINRMVVERAPAFFHFLACTGQPVTAIRLSQEWTVEEPTSAERLNCYTHHLFLTGNYAEAIVAAKRALELEPLSFDAHTTYVLSLMALDRHGEALDHVRNTDQILPLGSGLTSVIEMVVAKSFEERERAVSLARKVIDDESKEGTLFRRCLQRMFAHVTLNQTEEAIRELGQIPMNHSYAHLLHLHPELNGLRSHSLFIHFQQQALPPTLQQLIEAMPTESSKLIPNDLHPDDQLIWREHLTNEPLCRYLHSAAPASGQPNDT